MADLPIPPLPTAYIQWQLHGHHIIETFNASTVVGFQQQRLRLPDIRVLPTVVESAHANSHRLLLLLLQTAGFVCPSKVAPRSATIHRAVTTTATTSRSPWIAAPARKNACLRRQQDRRSPGGARDRSNHVHSLGARRRDDFFDDDDDLYDDLDDGRSMAPQRRRPKVPLLPPTLSKVSYSVHRRYRGSPKRVGTEGFVDRAVRFAVLAILL